MSAPFRQIVADHLPGPHRKAALALEDHFDRLERFFHTNLAAPGRLKQTPDEAISTPSAVRELAGLYALRALELAEGAVLLLEARNPAAAMPVARSLLEVWFATRYVEVNFSKSIEKGNPEGFKETVRRPLAGRSGGPGEPPPPVSIGKIKGVALEVTRHEPLEIDGRKTTLGREMALMYDQLSDGSHPSQWSMMPYYQDRDDGLGNDWLRKPTEMPDLYALSLIYIPLGYIRFDLGRLLILADQAEGIADKEEGR